MSTTSVNSEQKWTSDSFNSLLPISVDVWEMNKKSKVGRSFGKFASIHHCLCPLSIIEHGLIYGTHEEGCQERASLGNTSRQHVPANSSDSTFHRQENNGVPKDEANFTQWT